MKDRINVRCCCQPQKILGTLPAPSEREVHYRVPLVRILLKESVQNFDPLRFGSEAVEVERVCLPLQTLINEGGRRELAYKSEETPIEKLKRIPGFEPA